MLTEPLRHLGQAGERRSSGIDRRAPASSDGSRGKPGDDGGGCEKTQHGREPAGQARNGAFIAHRRRRRGSAGMTACSCWPRCPPGASTETPGQACLRGSGLGDPGDARSRAAFAVDGCVPMSSRCRMSNSDDLAPFGSAHGCLGGRFAASPAKGRACLFGPCEVGTSAPGPARNGRGRETRNPIRPTMSREAPRSDGTGRG